MIKKKKQMTNKLTKLSNKMYKINYDKKAYKIVNDEYTEIDDLYNGFDGNNLNIGGVWIGIRKSNCKKRLE